MKQLVTIILLAISTVVFSQEDKETISWTEIINMAEMTDSGKFLIIKNKRIIEGDEFQNEIKVYEPAIMDSIVVYVGQPIDKAPKCAEIHFENCMFFGNFNFKNTVFPATYFRDCNFLDGLSFDNCEIDEINFELKETKETSFKFTNCKIGTAWFMPTTMIDKNIQLLIDKSSVYETLGLSFKFSSINITNTDFIISEEFKNNYINTNAIYQLSLAQSIGGNVKIENCKFNFLRGINLSNININTLTMVNTLVNTINFGESTINKKLLIDSCFFEVVGVRNFNFPSENTNFSWSMLLGNKITFLGDEITGYDDSHYNSDSINISFNLINYNDLMATYNKFFHHYKERGDLKSANACYVEMKDAETSRLKYLYKTEGGIENYLYYNLNRFLKYFAEYGTSPVRSVQISGWVILIFACFYFFFYSDWDKISKKYLIGVSEKLISYFSSEQKLEDFYSEKHKEDFNTFDQFKSNIQKSKHDLPFFFMLFLKPLYWFSVVKYSFNKSLYKKVEFLQGRWSDLAIGKKILLGTLTFLGILSYTGYLIIVRSLNSLILSINTFTTLGFGDIPVVGLSRYIAILEGFLGWFLLSIFSVSLISQILQN